MGWLVVLKLTDKWGFHSIRHKSIQELSQMDVDMVLRIEVALKFGIIDWYEREYMSLVKRKDPLTR